MFQKCTSFAIMNIIWCVMLAGLLSSTNGIDVESVTAFGDKLYDTISKVIENTGENITAKRADCIREIDMKTTCVQCAVIDDIGLPSRMKKIRDIRTYTNLNFDYVKKVILAEDEDSRKQAETLFEYHFEAYKSDIDNLKVMVMIVIVDDGKAESLLNAVVDEVDCSITKFDMFRDVYLDLVSTGLALNMMNVRLSDPDQVANVKTEWIEHIKDMLNYFENERNGCINKFREYAEKDFTTITNEKDLFTTLQSRYSDKLVDVVYIPRPFGFYYRTGDQLLFKENGNSPIRAAIFSLRKPYTEFPNDEQMNVAIKDLNDNDACGKDDTMQLILNKTMEMFKWLSHQPRLCIVVPNRLSNDSIYLSNGSPGKVSTFTLGDCGEYTIVTYDFETTTNPGETSDTHWVTEKMPPATTAGPVVGHASDVGSAKFSLSLLMIMYLIAVICT